MSSSESPLASVQSRTIDISESQPNAAQVISDDSPPLIPVVHTPASSERLQAHIQSIQTQGQATAVAGTNLGTWNLCDVYLSPILVLYEIPSVAGEWIFFGTTHLIVQWSEV